ncbi:GntR family transcriptional regulator [Nocardioides mangrovicus]|uniref:GntR family transcriptional regulator n=1 Tax=Nocardioides mangrovicus TaxID=2478913 RepID=A0A3L8P4Y5_9ACTN|nr:GntR family transcriptional regulator [Nocardioides mangrovicus]
MLRLREEIVAGTHQPGDRLVEQQLCQAYGVSRVPVREALKQLEAEGFVVSRAYAGVRVAHLSADDAEDLFAVRTSIESITARRAALRFKRGDDEVEGLRTGLCHLVEEGERLLDAGRRDDLPPLNTAFHLGIAELCGNHSLTALLRQVSAKIQWLYAMDVDVRGGHSWTEHRTIADAVLAGRAGEAARLMTRHISNSKEGYLLRHAAPGVSS